MLMESIRKRKSELWRGGEDGRGEGANKGGEQRSKVVQQRKKA